MGTFLLAVAAIVGTLMIVLNPVRPVLNNLEGKRLSEIEDVADSYLANTSTEKKVGEVAKWGCFIVLALLFTWVVEPIAVFSAVNRKVGNETVAYIMLAVVAIKWFVGIRAAFFTKKKKDAAPTLMTVTPTGHQVEGKLIGVDEEIRLGNPIVRGGRAVFYALPTLYLWYLFALSIHVITA